MKKVTIFGAGLLSFSLLLSGCGQTEESSSNAEDKEAVTTANESSEENEAQSEETQSEEAPAEGNEADTNESDTEASSESTTEEQDDAAGSSEESTELTYTIKEEVYTDNGVTIYYPQLTNVADTAKQDKLNDLLFNEARKVMNFYEGTEGLELDVDYAVSYESPSFLSVQYDGIGNVEGTAHPNNHFYTTNIDLANMQRMKLSDVVTIDESFVELFKSDAFKAVNHHHNELAAEIKENVTVASLQNADSLDGIGTEYHSETFTYFTEDSIGITVSASHAIGGYAAFEMSYSDAPEGMWNGDKIWSLIKK